MSNNIAKLTIGKELIEIDIDEELSITDLDKNMDEVSSQIGYYGELLGAAKKEERALEGAYRRWRADCGTTMLKKDPKLAEWKIKAFVEEQEKFEQFKKAQAQCIYNIITLDNVIKGLCEKSPNLRSKGARMRAEGGSQDMTTPTEERRERTAARREEVRGKGKGRKKS